jgi:peptide/nickel transport system permease protein
VRSAINPITTLLALEVSALIGSAVLVETVFNVPGIGRLAYNAIVEGDFAVVQGAVLVAALFVIVANIVVDIGYAYIDPRVRCS